MQRNLVARTADAPTEEEERNIRRRLAVVAGITDYAVLPKLPNAAPDAQGIEHLLRAEYDFETILLLDREASRDAICEAIESTLSSSGEHTQWLFFFAGHGAPPEPGRPSYLSPWSLDSEETVELQWLVRKCVESRCAETLAILDNCYSGQALVRPEDLEESLSERSFRIPGPRQILAAGGPYQSVPDGGGEGHSLFTQCLLQALEGHAGVHDEQGGIAFSRLRSYLKSEVTRRSKALFPGHDPQIVVGGAWIVDRDQRDFQFEAQCPRLSPQVFQELGSDRAKVVLQGLERLTRECEEAPSLVRVARLRIEKVFDAWVPP